MSAASTTWWATSGSGTTRTQRPTSSDRSQSGQPPCHGLAALGVDRNARITMQGGCFLARVTHTTLWSKMSHPALDGAVDIGFRLVAVPEAAEW